MTDRTRPNTRRRPPVVAGHKGRKGGEPRADGRPPAGEPAPASFVVARPAATGTPSVAPSHLAAPAPAPQAAVAPPAAVPAAAAGPSRPDEGEGARAPRSRSRLVAAGLAPLALASLVAAGVLYAAGTSHHDRLVADQQAAETARSAVAATARSAAAAVLSYDYRHFDADVRRADGYLTGRLRSDYDKLQRSSVGPTARQVHAQVTATVKGVAVTSVSGDAATVLVFVDQLSRNTKIAAPRLDQDRVTMHFTKVGGRWLVSEFDAL